MTPSPGPAPRRSPAGSGSTATTKKRSRKPRRRWKTSLRFVLTAGIVSLLIVGAFAADGAARGYVESRVETQVRTSLDVPESTPVTVSVGGTSVLLQLLSGRLDRIDIGIAQVSLGALAGSAQVSASGIPLDAGRPMAHARIVFTTDQAALKSLFSTIPGLSPKSIAIGDGTVTLGTEVTMGSFSLPVGIEFSVAAKKGQLQLTPTSIVINKIEFTAKELKASAFSSLTKPLFTSHSVCVASLLPKKFTLDSVYVTGTSVQLAVSARDVPLNSSTLEERGTCAEE